LETRKISEETLAGGTQAGNIYWIIGKQVKKQWLEEREQAGNIDWGKGK
jgi:hypothetical protein